MLDIMSAAQWLMDNSETSAPKISENPNASQYASSSTGSQQPDVRAIDIGMSEWKVPQIASFNNSILSLKSLTYPLPSALSSPAQSPMPTQFQIECELDFPAELFWPLRASDIFLNFLLRDGCLSHMESHPATLPDPNKPNMIHRRQTYAPNKMDIPDYIRAILPRQLILVRDSQTWDLNQDFTQNFNCKPTVLSEFVTTDGSLFVKRKEGDEKKCIHTIQGQTTVNMPLLGYYIEQAIVRNMQAFYSTYPKHVKNFKQYLVNEFVDGDLSKLEVAVQRVLQQAEQQGETVRLADGVTGKQEVVKESSIVQNASW